MSHCMHMKIAEIVEVKFQILRFQTFYSKKSSSKGGIAKLELLSRHWRKVTVFFINTIWRHDSMQIANNTEILFEFICDPPLKSRI